MTRAHLACPNTLPQPLPICLLLPPDCAEPTLPAAATGPERVRTEGGGGGLKQELRPPSALPPPHSPPISSSSS
eukprot:7338390-Pyramimonas_sp.AAC.1